MAKKNKDDSRQELEADKRALEEQMGIPERPQQPPQSGQQAPQGQAGAGQGGQGVPSLQEFEQALMQELQKAGATPEVAQSIIELMKQDAQSQGAQSEEQIVEMLLGMVQDQEYMDSIMQRLSGQAPQGQA